MLAGAASPSIATPDVVIARCVQLLLVVEVFRLWLLCLGRGPRIYDHPRPLPPPPWPYDWAAVGGWPA